MASTVASNLEETIDISVFEQSSPDSLHPRALSPPASTHNLSRSTSSNPTFDHEVEDDYFGHVSLKQCNSSRSSISSFPSSVIHTFPATDNEGINSRTPSRSQLLSNGRNSPALKTSSNSYLSAFRHPNSVRALQLESEYADSDNYSIARSPRPRKSPKTSYFSPRSPGSTHSSPTKRSTRPGTPQHQRSNSKLKKEFPLVLLHCTLLPPAATKRGSSVSEEILEAVLPENYRKRWRTLRDKVTRNPEVKQRGVLIAHPRDDYDLLEERLLEALELERPRIRKGHYMGNRKSDSDSGFESSSQNGTDDGTDPDNQENCSSKEKCPDCGTSVSCKIEQVRKWEVKIFAANGLMRNDAWSAAWEQMEKIDVEVALWMPEDVRFEVEERLKALQAMEEAERPVEEPIDRSKKERTRSNTAKLRHDERMREIYGEPEQPRTQEEIDGLAQPRDKGHRSLSIYTPHVQDKVEEVIRHIPPELGYVPIHFQQQEAPPQLDFLTFMKHRFRMIVNDQRNLAIVLLSVLVLFFSVQNLDASNGSSSQQPGVVQSVSTSIDAVTEISVVTTETPVVSYVTTTILATPSDVVPITHLEEEAQDVQNVPHIDHMVILDIVSDKQPTSSTIADSIMETSSAEPETETADSAPPLLDQPRWSELSQATSEFEEDAVFADVAGREENTNVKIFDDSADVESDRRVMTDADIFSQYEMSIRPIAEMTLSQDVSKPSGERIETFTLSEEPEQLKRTVEPPIEPEIIDLLTLSDFRSVSAADIPDSDREPKEQVTNDQSNTNINVHNTTPEHIFNL